MTIYLKTNFISDDMTESDEQELAKLLLPYYKHVSGIGYYFDYSKKMITNQRTLFIVIVNDELERSYMRDLDKLRNEINQVINMQTSGKKFISFQILKEEDRRYAWLTTDVTFLSKPPLGDYAKARPDVKNPTLLQIELEDRTKSLRASKATKDDVDQVAQPVLDRQAASLSKFPTQEVKKSTQQPKQETTFDAYFIDDQEIKFEKTLGAGAFGVVHQGVRGGHTKVAIKELLIVQPSTIKEFLDTEVAAMKKLRHPNIVQFYGVCTDPKYCIVMEYMAKGNLTGLLCSGQSLDWNLRYQIACDIARGMAFLHDQHVLHRDLKSENILLDEHYRAKLGDFGLSKLKESILKTTRGSVIGGTYAYLAPELSEPDESYTKASDIYSLGMIFWEIASLKKPYADVEGIRHPLIPLWVAQKKKWEKIPDGCPAKFASLIDKCRDLNPTKRPNAKQIYDEIITLRNELHETKASQLPIKPVSQITDHSLSSASIAREKRIVLSIAKQSLEYIRRLKIVLGTYPFLGTEKSIVEYGDKENDTHWVSFPLFWLNQLSDEKIDELSQELKLNRDQLRSAHLGILIDMEAKQAFGQKTVEQLVIRRQTEGFHARPVTSVVSTHSGVEQKAATLSG